MNAKHVAPIFVALALLAGAPLAEAVRGKAQNSTHHIYVHVMPPAQGQEAEVVVKLDTEAPAPPAPSEPKAATEAAEVEPAEAAGMNMGLLFFVFVLAIFVGFELIAKVPSQLHTPLMSGSNAISGITIVGALLAVSSGNKTMTIILGTLAVAFAMINVVGGYVVTDRMLGMFKHKKGGAK